MGIFEAYHWLVGATFVVCISVLLSSLFLYFVKYTISKKSLKDSHDVVGFSFGVVGVVYAVILGFTVVNAQQRYSEAEKITQEEAMTLADLFRDAAMLPAPYNAEIQRGIKEYIQYTLNVEWPKMQNGESAVNVIETVRDLWKTYYKIKPQTEEEKIWFAESITKLNHFTGIRLQRVYNSEEALNPLMWSALYIGALITIGFLGLFWMDNFRMHLVVTAMLSGLIGYILYIIQALDTVYYGSMSITPKALEQVQHVLNTWY
jgi:hypothetical protein